MSVGYGTCPYSWETRIAGALPILHHCTREPGHHGDDGDDHECACGDKVEVRPGGRSVVTPE